MKLRWTNNPVFRCVFCPNVLSRNRFLSTLSMFYLSDNSLGKHKGDNGYDAVHKVKPLLDKILQKFRTS